MQVSGVIVLGISVSGRAALPPLQIMRVRGSRLFWRPMLLGRIGTAIGCDAMVSGSPGGCLPYVLSFFLPVLRSPYFQ